MRPSLKWSLVCLVAAWLSAMFSGLWWLGQNKLVPFDAQGRLQAAASTLDYEKQLSVKLAGELGSLTSTVVHFNQLSCFCRWVAQPHIESVRELASEQGFANLELSLSADWAALVPVSPAVAVFNEEGQLSYLGPYSSGFYCSAGNGLVEPFIERKSRLKGAFIASEAKGCYCPLA